ncbi:MAG: archease [Anaerolineae bacterium]
MGRWEERNHTADLCIHVWGADLEDLFATAARGMFALITDLESVPMTETEELHLNAPDVEVLLVDWLNELLYLAEAGDPLTAYTAFTFERLSTTALHAHARGGPITDYHAYIKAATYHNLQVRATQAGYETEIVFDT